MLLNKIIDPIFFGRDTSFAQAIAVVQRCCLWLCRCRIVSGTRLLIFYKIDGHDFSSLAIFTHQNRRQIMHRNQATVAALAHKWGKSSIPKTSPFRNSYETRTAKPTFVSGANKKNFREPIAPRFKRKAPEKQDDKIARRVAVFCISRKAERTLSNHHGTEGSHEKTEDMLELLLSHVYSVSFVGAWSYFFSLVYTSYRCFEAKVTN